MAESIQGVPQLQARIRAVGGSRLAIMKLAAAATRGQLVLGMREVGARKTGHTGQAVQVASVTETSALVTADAVAVWIDTGTGIYGPAHHRITPRAAKALSWMGGTYGRGGSLRLTGSPRKGKAGLGASRVTVRSTRGMRARPYIAKSLRAATAQVSAQGADQVIISWNGAA